ncbi:metal ABC transporter permease [Rothia sp. ZJ1223]|uniref:metal ABC transporter permease n=1 Tax=Rothia sp. ZJ1223 TaxID=2811098 RepID=UPI00195CF1B7|nr:iron chelate uptake ABC transporter family permease subunit [Rothia sp. ZJ1223]MBM7051633.1 metal ABC transporter permease [Rothia sp. ZJ1223]
MEFLIDPLAYDFMVRALAVTVLAALTCALLSCWLVLMGWSLMGDAISHAVLPGVVLAYIFGAPFSAGALVAALVAVGLIGLVRRGSPRIREDAAIGIVFTTLFALGLVLISVTPSNTDLHHILFGNVLGVSAGDLLQVGGLGALVALVLLIKRKDLTLYAFDPGYAHAIGMRPHLLGALLLVVLALTNVIALQVVGVVLVVAMLIIPGATARMLTNRFPRMLLVSCAVSVVGSVTGLYASYYLDVSPGGAVVLVLGGLFFIVYLFSPTYGVISSYLRSKGTYGRF